MFKALGSIPSTAKQANEQSHFYNLVVQTRIQARPTCTIWFLRPQWMRTLFLDDSPTPLPAILSVCWRKGLWAWQTFLNPEHGCWWTCGVARQAPVSQMFPVSMSAEAFWVAPSWVHMPPSVRTLPVPDTLLW
jgi:hypothetical protein